MGVLLDTRVKKPRGWPRASTVVQAMQPAALSIAICLTRHVCMRLVNKFSLSDTMSWIGTIRAARRLLMKGVLRTTEPRAARMQQHSVYARCRFGLMCVLMLVALLPAWVQHLIRLLLHAAPKKDLHCKWPFLGVPWHLSTDAGPCLASSAWKSFC